MQLESKSTFQLFLFTLYHSLLTKITTYFGTLICLNKYKDGGGTMILLYRIDTFIDIDLSLQINHKVR